MGKAWGLWVLISLAVVGGCGVLLGGCGERDRLDTTRQVLDATAQFTKTLYQAAVVTCDTVPRVVIKKNASTQEEADAIDAEIAAKCEAVYDLFEAVRSAHEAALAILAQVEAGQRPVGALLASLSELGELAVRAQQAWQSLRDVLERGAADPGPDDVSRRLDGVRRWAAAERERWAS